MRLALEENERALKILEEQQKNRDDAAMAEDRVAEYCRKFSEGLDDLDQEGRRAVFSAFGAKFTATRDELQVSITVDPAVTAMSPTTCCRGSSARPSWADAIRRGRGQSLAFGDSLFGCSEMGFFRSLGLPASVGGRQDCCLGFALTVAPGSLCA